MTYPDAERLQALGRLARNACFVKADITGDGVAETFCNNFVQVVAVALGCDDLSQDGGTALAAYHQINAMRGSPAWADLGQDAETAQAWANAGYLVVAAHQTSPRVPSHVAIVMPGQAQLSGKHGHLMPMGANVGRSNFDDRHLGWAFTHAECPLYYGWKGNI